jgi:UDP-N-acetylglucosamine 3-dehydrogenase
MKIALLGTGFGQAHAAVYAERSDVNEVVVFGRSPRKLAKIKDQFGFATTTDLDAVITDPSVDLVDICLPTKVHAEVAVRAMQADKDVLVELPLAATLEDAHRIVVAQQASGRRAFVDMSSRFSPANQHLRQAVADQRYGPLKVLEIEGRTALLWEGLDMMHADFDLVTGLLGRPETLQVTGTEGSASRGSAAIVNLGYPHAVARCASSSLMPQPYGMRGGYCATFTLHAACRAHRPRPQHPDRMHRRWGACHRPARHQPAHGDDRPCAGLDSTPTTSSNPPAPSQCLNSP